MEEFLHKMEQIGFVFDEDSETWTQKRIIPQESWLLSVQRCIKHLCHASQCRGTNCKLPTCQKIKRVAQHAKSCKLKTKGECPTCRELIVLCCYHAKSCEEAKCPVILCSTIKKYMKHGQLQQQLHQAIKKRIDIFMMKHRKSAAILQTSLDNSNSSNQPLPGAKPYSSPDPPQLGIGMDPSTGPWLTYCCIYNKPVGALQAVTQVQAAAAGQIAPHMVAASVNYGKDNPVVSPQIPNAGLMAATQQLQARMQEPVPQMMSGVSNHMLNMGNVSCCEGSGFAQNPQPHQNPQTQPNPQFGLRQPTQHMGGPNKMSNSIGNSAMGPPQVMPNPGLSLGELGSSYFRL